MIKASFKVSRLLIGAGIVLAIFIIFNSRIRTTVSKDQQKFSNWYSSVQTSFVTNVETPASSPPPVIITLDTKDSSGKNVQWIIKSPDQNVPLSVSKERVGRILQLINESEVLSLGDSRTSNDRLLLTVEVNNSRFSASFLPSDLESNIKLKNLIKLFQVFVMTAPVQSTPFNPTTL